MEVMATTYSNEMCSNSATSEVPLAFTSNQTTKTPSADITTSEIPSSRVESPAKSPSKGISEGAVDSALLCAMRDPRERRALLRLEQTMIDFMREDTTGFIEVGGANNSIVVSPSGNIGNKSLQPTPSEGRQTSFQRCWLHRLADRFGIIRETNADGMIRLVKVKESCIPSSLLIDLDPSEYEVEDVRGLASKLSDTSLTNSKPQKMKIMKRSSSGLTGSSNSLKSDGKGSRRKNLSDKEKAYAEARARIFSEEASGGTTTTPAASDTLVPSQAICSNERTGSSSCLSPEQQQQQQVSSPPAVARSESEERSGRNKATYRNRQQEAADPDFQRLHSMQQQQQQYEPYIPPQQPFTGYNPHAPQFYPSQSYAYQQQLPQQQQQQQYSGYAVDGEIFYPYPPQQGGLSRTSSTASAGKTADVNNFEEFPSLG